ncbi:MAG: GNAT family N-acetyltransferase [Proteobacteria bacterium]|nr:GNAT family N-acetyltransferase [Pseudomonadota bacterium]
MKPIVRKATTADSAAVIAVVRKCCTQFEGVEFDLDAERPELKDFARYYRGLEGEAWVAELDGAVVGCAAIAPDDRPGMWMLHKLNVLPTARRLGVAAALVREAEAAARAQDAVRMALWSDARFTESHAFYASLGYEKIPVTRGLDDLSKTVEFRFRKSL